jgi:branched-chain amino acid transport system substrate-binding protein
MVVRLVCFACLFSLMLTPGCGKTQDPGPQDTVRIGFLGSPDRASYADAARVAINEINLAGGLLGRSVELVVGLDIVDAAVAVQTAELMICTHKVIALIGPNRSTHAVEVGAVAQRERLPMITTAATNPDVTGAGDFVFMAAFTDRFQGLVLARFAREDLGLTSVAVLTLKDDVYTEGISAFFVSRFTGIGGTVVVNEFYESGETVFTGQLARIAAARPEAFFISGQAPDVSLVARQAREISLQTASGEPVVFLGADVWDNPALLARADDDVEGSYFSGHFSSHTDEPGARAFIEAYEADYGTAPGGGDAVSYDAVKLFLDAVDRAGRFDAEAIRDQLAATRDYSGATRIARYNENRHPTKSAVIFTIKNGEKQFHKQVDPF